MSLENVPLSRPKYRADIDGLRAIAVLLVIGFHAFPNWVKGGFIGVDVFFVISGFLISTIILGGLDQGSFSFADFYGRRIKRIFPALILVMAVCFVLGWFALFPPEYKQLGRHILAGAGFFSNFIFWSEAGYFDNSAVTKPLLHLWSLGIEEQFYIAWPLLLYLAWKRRLNLLSVIVVIAVVSFTINVAGINRDATAVFYSPVSRVWELLLGSVLAYVKLKRTRALPASECIGAQSGQLISAGGGSILRNVQAAVGLVLIILAGLLLKQAQLFPGWWALFPTLGALLIISTNAEAWPNRILLSNRLLVWLGVISYPLYLWHWPLLSFAHIVESGTPSPAIRMSALAIALLLAWLTYLLIERPVRFGTHAVRAKVMTLCVLMALLGAAGYWTYERDGLGFRPMISRNLQQQQAFIWKEEYNTQEACVQRYPFYGRYCMQTFADRPATVALIGDSHANHLFFGLSEYYEKQGQNLLLLGARLPFWNLETGPPGTQATYVFYKEAMNSILDHVTKTDSIKTIILASAGVSYIDVKESAGYHLKLTTKPYLRDHAQIFAQAMRETLERLVRTDKQIIFVVDIPQLDFQPQSCVANRPLRLTHRVRSPCAVKKSTFNRRSAAYHAIVKTVLQDFPTITVFFAPEHFCDEDYCWAILGGKMLYREYGHLSRDGSLYIGSKFAATQGKASGQANRSSQ